MKAIGFRSGCGLIAFLLLAGMPVAGLATIIENFDTAPDPAEWTLSGNAAWDSDYQALFITDAANDQTGSIFWHEQLSGERFNIEFDFWIGAGSGADGMTFAWVRGPSLLGGGGGSMGFDGLDGYGVRFDTYSGGAPEPENYVAISEVTPSARTDLITDDTILEMEDAVTTEGLPAPFHVNIKFSDGHLEMWMKNETASTPMAERKVFDYTIAGYVAFDAYLGFTAATGGANNVHAVDNIVINRGAYAGEDQVVWAGDPVELDGSESYGATGYTWTQTEGEPEVELDDSTPSDGKSHFTAPALTVGTILTFQLEIESPDGPSSDTVVISIRAKNKPMLAPSDVQSLRVHRGIALSWDSLVDADEYILEVRAGDIWFPYVRVDVPEYTFENQPDGQLFTVRIRPTNDAYGDSDFTSDPVSMVILRNLALPPPNTTPPLAHVQGQTYVISHYSLADMNNGQYDDNNDSWDGEPKSVDFWGYLWGSPLYFQHIIYYQGDIFGNGGWWTSLKVQYTEDGTTWQDAHGLSIEPKYDFTDTAAAHTAYARYDIKFVRVNGVGVRISGTPGGTADFTSISELEVYGHQDATAAVADPGLDRSVQEGDPVSLSGENSQNAVTYEWGQIEGPTVTLTDPDQMEASFTAPSGPPDIVGDTDLVFLLTVTDATSRSSSAPVTITVIDADAVTAYAIPWEAIVREGALAQLMGSGSVNGVNFKWTQTSGPEVVIADNTQPDITFRAPPVFTDTTVTFELHVDNGPGQHSDTATVTLMILDGDGAIEVTKFDMTSIFNRDGIWSLAVGDQAGDGFDEGGDCLIEDGYSGWAGLPSDGKVQDFQLGDFDAANMFSVFSGDGDTTFDLSATGQAGNFQKLRFLTGAGNGYGGTSTDKLMVQLVYSDASTQEFLLLSQDWYLGSPPRTAPPPLTLGISGMLRASGSPSSNFGLFVFEFDGVDSTKTLTDIAFLESDPQSTIGGPSASNRFNVMAITGYPPSAVRTARLLPASYEPGTDAGGEIYVYVDPAETPPANIVVTEVFPAELTVVDAGGGTPGLGTITWTFTGAGVQSQVISYTLGIPGTQTGAIEFSGTLSYGTVTGQPIGGDQGLYMIPSAPTNVRAEVLVAAYVSWSVPPEGGIAGYRVYRSVDGGDWEEVAFVTDASYVDKWLWLAPESTYSYRVVAVNVTGAEGDASDPTLPATVEMLIREAEDFNYGGGLYPWTDTVTIAAVEATAADDLDGTDYWHPNTGGPDPRVYRPLDNRADGTGVAIETIEEVDRAGEYHTDIGWIDAGSWYRYTFDVPPPGAGDPEGGWVKFSFRVASPNGGTIAAYWDEQLVGTVSYVTGNYHIFTDAVLEEQVQASPGPHTLRVVSESGELNLDKIGIGFNWSAPKRKVLFEEDFEDWTNLYDDVDAISEGWTLEYGPSGKTDGSWRLWNTGGDLLRETDPDIGAMTSNYMISDSDMAGDYEMNEGLITPDIDATEYTGLRLNFNKNYRIYLEDATRQQIAEVDIRTKDPVTQMYSGWTNLLHWDLQDGVEYNMDPEVVDISAFDKNIIQIRWHYYDAQFDYWLAIDDIAVSGEREEAPPPVVRAIGITDGTVDLSWSAFADTYYVECTDDLVSGDWSHVAGPITDTSWSGDVSAICPGDVVYVRIRGE